MSATAPNGSPTLRRSVASRSVSQENAGPAEDMAARLVSSAFQYPLHSLPSTSNHKSDSTPKSRGELYPFFSGLHLPLPFQASSSTDSLRDFTVP